jgi:membrane-associated protease RseP (regulator of RpoE activity)
MRSVLNGWMMGGMLVAALGALGVADLAGAMRAEAQPARRDRAWLGVTLQELSPELREALGLDRRVRGALVSSVVKGGPAERAGIQIRDVLVEVDNVRVGSVDEAITAVRTLRPEKRIRVVVNRADREHGIDVTLGSLRDAEDRMDRAAPRFDGDDERPRTRVFRWFEDDDGDSRERGWSWRDDRDDDDPVRIEIYRNGDDAEPEVIVIDPDDLRDRLRDRFRLRREHDDGMERRHRDHAERMEREHRRHREPILPDVHRLSHPRGFLGVETQPLNDQLAEYFGAAGVLVSRVLDGSPADRGGLRAGDVIVAVGNETVETPADLRRAIRGMDPGHEADLRVIRKGAERTLRVELGETSDRSGLAPLPALPPLPGEPGPPGSNTGLLRIPEIDLEELPDLDIKGLDIEWRGGPASEDWRELEERLRELGEEIRSRIRIVDGKTTYE